MQKEQIRRIIYDSGADVCGFAHISQFENVEKKYHPCTIWKDCKSVIVFGIALPESLFDINSRLIYAHFNTISIQQADNISFKSARTIEKSEGITSPSARIKALPLPSDGPYEQWDKDTMTGHGLVSVKQAAVFAGLGSLGKNTLLINKDYGNRLTLGLILLDTGFEPDAPAEDLCIPSCSLCVRSCPVQAIGDKNVNQKKCRLNTYKQTERGFDTIECYKCRSVCPLRYGKKATK